MPRSARVEPFEQVEREWERILHLCATDTIFLTPGWQGTWLRHFGVEADLRIVSVQENGATLGIAPLMLKDGVLSFLGGTDLFDYHDFLVPKGNETSFYSVLFDFIEDMEWHTLDLQSLPQDSPSLQFVPAMAKQKGYAHAVMKEGSAPFALLPPTWDEYQARLGKKSRHELRRKLRRLGAAGDSRQYTYDDPDALPEGMQDFFRLHRASRPEKAEFLTAQRESFFVDVALELARRGQFRLSFLEFKGARVASCISFDYLDSYLLYNSGYDPTYSHLSVGLLNKALTIKDAIEAGKRRFDFLRGNERYKYDLGGEDQAVYQLVVQR